MLVHYECGKKQIARIHRHSHQDTEGQRKEKDRHILSMVQVNDEMQDQPPNDKMDKTQPHIRPCHSMHPMENNQPKYGTVEYHVQCIPLEPDIRSPFCQQNRA